MTDHYQKIKNIFQKARSEGRDFLLEPEVYQIFEVIGLKIPAHFFLPRGTTISDSSLAQLPTDKVVVKVVSPQILHKSDWGGVKITTKDKDHIGHLLTVMEKEIRAKAKTAGFLDSLEIKGFLICELVPYENIGLGTELIYGVKLTREFGPVLHLGWGGKEVEFIHRLLTPEGTGLTVLAEDKSSLDLEKTLEKNPIIEKLCRPFRGQSPIIKASYLVKTLRNLSSLCSYFSPLNAGAEFSIEEIEANPVVISNHKQVALDGLCRFSSRQWPRVHPPPEAIDFLLHPRSIGIIGVSKEMNIGRIILQNIINAGFPAEKIMVIKPGMKTIDGCRCYPHLANLPQSLDLFIVAIPAEKTPPLIEEIILQQKAKSVILISGGIGEKKGTEKIEQNIKTLIEKHRQEKGKLTPILNGGNCLGVFSSPGHFDTTFVPAVKIYPSPRPKKRLVPLAFISQSGALMISILSNLPFLQPAYGISIGNQIDLTASEYLNYFADRDNILILAIYLEGFREGDGWRFIQAARRFLQHPNRVIIVYKGGRSAFGQEATSSHTASIAGDYHIFEQVMKQEGIIVAKNLRQFQQLIMGFSLLVGKRGEGTRLALITNAGFESVATADLFQEEDVTLSSFSSPTKAKLNEILAKAEITQLQDIRNPLDLTPLADDYVFTQVVETVLKDDEVDGIVVSPVPMTTALNTLPPSSPIKENFTKPGTLVKELIRLFHHDSKPLVVNIDAGEVYQPLVDFLQQQGLPVFRKVDEATRFLQCYLKVNIKKYKPEL